MIKTRWNTYFLIFVLSILFVDLLLISLNSFHVESVFRPVYNVFFYHVSSAWLSYLTFTVSLICSVMYLKTKEMKWSRYGKNSVLIGVLFAAVALITGSLWFNATSGNYQNIFWNWDPRQTMTLVLLFSYISYLIYWSMIEDPTQKAKLTSILGIVLFPTVPLSYFAAIIFASLHPLIEPSPSNIYWDPFKIFTLIFTVITVTIFYIYTLKKLGELDERKAKLGGLYHKKMEEE
ncbi:MAG: cytochrome c biogenesis protein CcsA [Candidatus Helarchaeota archaeon]|nr:cytochrome c biogenesis protein CcsA [Candidatus Helarchaeota archaeon]